jgi:hypothetical protein
MKNIILTIALLFPFIIGIHAESLMDTVTIEINDSELNTLYFYQESFDTPTRLIFPNLTTVTESVYFDQNVNLVSVDMPQLSLVGDYVYFNGNDILESISSPMLNTIHNYLYVSQNTNLEELNICSLKNIMPSEDDDQVPYYYINNNNATVDQQPFCFSQGSPENLSLSNSSILENSPLNSFIGKLSAESNYEVIDLTFYLTDDNFNNEYFTIQNDSLFSNAAFDFEVMESQEITIGVYNQLGESITVDFTINVENILNEDVEIIEILDDTLASLYYHQENFTKQTKLVFPNLTTVTGIAYFHQNVNLISVDLPKLNFVGDYTYFHGNEVIESINAPLLDTIFNYLYVSQNTNLIELEICSLSHIISTEPDMESYYFVQNNPMLNLSNTCLDSTILEFIEEDSLVVASNILLGRFQSNSTDPITHYIDDGGLNVTETENFIIDEIGIYLKKDIVEYTEDSYPLLINSFRIDQNTNTILNEQIVIDINLNIKDKVIITGVIDLDVKNEIRYYPNPTNSILTIEIQAAGTYRLYDPYGKVIETFNFAQGLNQIDLSKLNPNIYYLASEYGQRIKIAKQ